MQINAISVFALSCGAAIVASLAHLPAVASTRNEPPAWPSALREDMVRFADVEWKLREAAGDACPSSSAAIGVRLDYIEAYAEKDRALVAQVLNMSGRPQVAAVMDGSPAAESGIRPGDEILAINGKAVAELLEEGGDPTLFADWLEEKIAATPAGTAVSLDLAHDGAGYHRDVAPKHLCGARFLTKTDNGIDAYSDGTNIAVTSGLIAFAQSDDELALVAGHELAHIVHRDGKARSLSQRRTMEDRADLLGAELARCAGYDIEKSLMFWQRFRKRDWLGFLRDPSHRSVSDRMEAIRNDAQRATCPPRPELLLATEQQ